MLKLLLFVVPLGLDTFAVSAALGLAGLSARERLRISLLLPGFEMAMPVIGLLAGRGLGTVFGSVADYVAVAVLAALGVYMFFEGKNDERPRVGRFVSGRGLALLALGISVSLDELAMGFSIGLLHLSLVAAVIMIGVQTVLVVQLGVRFGARLGESLRERAERLAGLALIGLAAFLLADRLVR